MKEQKHLSHELLPPTQEGLVQGFFNAPLDGSPRTPEQILEQLQPAERQFIERLAAEVALARHGAFRLPEDSPSPLDITHELARDLGNDIFTDVQEIEDLMHITDTVSKRLSMHVTLDATPEQHLASLEPIQNTITFQLDGRQQNQLSNAERRFVRAQEFSRVHDLLVTRRIATVSEYQQLWQICEEIRSLSNSPNEQSTVYNMMLDTLEAFEQPHPTMIQKEWQRAHIEAHPDNADHVIELFIDRLQKLPEKVNAAEKETNADNPFVEAWQYAARSSEYPLPFPVPESLQVQKEIDWTSPEIWQKLQQYTERVHPNTVTISERQGPEGLRYKLVQGTVYEIHRALDLTPEGKSQPSLSEINAFFERNFGTEVPTVSFAVKEPTTEARKGTPLMRATVGAGWVGDSIEMTHEIKDDGITDTTFAETLFNHGYDVVATYPSVHFSGAYTSTETRELLEHKNAEELIGTYGERFKVDPSLSPKEQRQQILERMFDPTTAAELHDVLDVIFGPSGERWGHSRGGELAAQYHALLEGSGISVLLMPASQLSQKSETSRMQMMFTFLKQLNRIAKGPLGAKPVVQPTAEATTAILIDDPTLSPEARRTLRKGHAATTNNAAREANSTSIGVLGVGERPRFPLSDNEMFRTPPPPICVIADNDRLSRHDDVMLFIEENCRNLISSLENHLMDVNNREALIELLTTELMDEIVIHLDGGHYAFLGNQKDAMVKKVLAYKQKMAPRAHDPEVAKFIADGGNITIVHKNMRPTYDSLKTQLTVAAHQQTATPLYMTPIEYLRILQSVT